MRKTANYELNQWDPGDRILREEFNGDNARIDAALAAIPYVKIMEIDVTQAVQQIDLEIGPLDLSEYAALKIYCRTVGGNYLVRVNRQTSYRHLQSYSGADDPSSRMLYAEGAEQYPTAAEITLSGFPSGTLLGICNYGCATNTVGGTMGSAFLLGGRPLETISLIMESGSFQIGSHISMYGVKQ